MNKIITSSLLLALTLLSSLVSASEQPPNIVVIFTDDQSYTAMGAMGNSEIKTPNMDQLAADGVMFKRHYNNTSICMASRATLMTGLLEYKHGTNFHHGSMSQDIFAQSYPVLLKKAGYYTGFAGKFGFPVTKQAMSSIKHNTYDKLPVNEFDNWAGGTDQTKYLTKDNKYIAKYAANNPHSTQAYAAWAKDFISQAKASGKPFNMSLYFKAPHLPSKPDPAFDDVYKGAVFSKPENFGQQAGKHLAKQAKLGRQYLSYNKKYKLFTDYNEVKRNYYQLLYGVDVALGKVRAELEKQGVADNTVIIFTSDNGYSQGAHGLSGKTLPYEESTRVPLVIYDPRVKKQGQVSSALTAGVDLTATIFDLANVAAPSNIDGTSLLPLLDNPESKVRDSVTLIQTYGSAATHSLAVIYNDWKYIYWPFQEDNLLAGEELFHLSKDSLEMQNVANNPENKQQLQQLKNVYDQAVIKWQEQSLAVNEYSQYGQIFSRHVDWQTKRPLYTKAAMGSYQKEINPKPKKKKKPKKDKS